MIPGSANPLLLKSAAAAGGLQVSRSLRFNASDSAYLSRTPAVAGNRRTWTLSWWQKLVDFPGSISGGTERHIFFTGSSTSQSSSTYFRVLLSGDNTISINNNTDFAVQTTRTFRDFSAWYNFVLTFDTTQTISADRVKLYINGTQETTFQSPTYPSINTDYAVNQTAYAFRIGSEDLRRYFSGYLANIHFIDGQALTPSSFTETDATTGQLIPKTYTGSYGTNGFNLLFADNSSNTASTLGKDTSGNSNNWTPNNLSVTAGAGNDSLVDSPTNYGTDTGVGGEVRGNYCTINPLANGGAAPSNGNLQLSGWGTSYGSNRCNSTIAVSSGKWYWETTLTTVGTYTLVGVNQDDITTIYPGYVATSYAYECETGNRVSANTTASYGTALTTNGDILMIALDLDNNKIFFGKNGTWFASANPATGANPAYTITAGTYRASFRPYGSGVDVTVNFGARSFAYTAPSGFKALCTQNLPAPLVTKSNTVMDVKLYTGNSSTQTISGLGFSPDLVWLKNRTAGDYHRLNDIIRGANRHLFSNTTDAEVVNDANGYLSAFTSDGFSLTSGTGVNASGNSYVGWCWDAGTSTVSNTQGSITGGSPVRANASAGFSVVTWTGDGGTNKTVGHGLGVAPQFIIVKWRNGSSDWECYHASTGNTKVLNLNNTNAANTYGHWGNTSPTSTVFTVNANGTYNEVNGNGQSYVAYVFSPIVGYNSFGSYTGNGSADGPFVYTGFRPRFLLVKNATTGGSGYNWEIYDSARNTYNVMSLTLLPNTADAEINAGSGVRIDFLSNGFKWRDSGASINGSGNTMIYAAFAESPFNYARAR